MYFESVRLALLNGTVVVPSHNHNTSTQKQTSTLKKRRRGRRHLLPLGPFAYDANAIRLSATDVLAPTTMKNAAKCDT